MADKRLIVWIKINLKNKVSKEAIYSKLIQEGHSENAINEAFLEIKKQKRTKFIHMLAILIIPLAVFGLLLLVLPEPKEINCINNIDCDDFNQNTLNRCLNSNTKEAYCDNVLIVDISNDFMVEESVSFTYELDSHIIEVESVDEASVTLLIYSEPKRITLKIGEEIEFDLDNDGVNDVLILLVEIKGNKPVISISKIEEIKEDDVEDENEEDDEVDEEDDDEDGLSECKVNSDCKDDYKCSNNECVECNGFLDCFDDDPLTVDSCINNKCVNEEITECIDDDNACPEGCIMSTDNDCTTICGGDKKIDCGTDDEINLCYMQAIEECCPAKLIHEHELNVMGLIYHTTSYLAIKGFKDDNCEEFTEVEEYFVSASDELVEFLLNENKTQEEIDQLIQDANDELPDMVGKSGSCFYPVEALINRSDSNSNNSISFSTDDCVTYNCEGSLWQSCVDLYS